MSDDLSKCDVCGMYGPKMVVLHGYYITEHVSLVCEHCLRRIESLGSRRIREAVMAVRDAIESWWLENQQKEGGS